MGSSSGRRGRQSDARSYSLATTHDPNPSLVEAFVEFLFAPPDGAEWDSFVVPAYYKRIHTKFPTRKRSDSVGTKARLPSGGSQPKFPLNGSPTPWHRFISKDEKTLVQLGENLLVVNQLPPYHGWDVFRPTVIECFESYVKLWKPERVVRASLHYIDKIELPEDDAGLEKYFNLLPILPEFPDKPATNVSMSYEVAGAGEGDVMVVAMWQHPSADPDGLTFLFRRDYEAADGFSPDRDATTGWLDRAHDYLHRTFKDALTDECRNLFK